MKSTCYLLLIVFGIFSCSGPKHAQSEKWISLFNGKSFDGWKVGQNAETFSVDSGMIRVNGKVAHLFYDGNVNNHEFKNFHFKAEVMTTLDLTPEFISTRNTRKKVGLRPVLKFR
jgi:hypothetical protein